MAEGERVVSPFGGEDMLRISRGHLDTEALQSDLECWSVGTGVDKMD